MLQQTLIAFLLISSRVLALPGVDVPSTSGFGAPVDVPNPQSKLMAEAELRKKLQENLDKVRKESLLKTFEAACESAGLSETTKACADVMSKVMDLNKPDVAILASALTLQQIDGIALLASIPKVDTGLLVNLVESLRDLLFSATPAEKIDAELEIFDTQIKIINMIQSSINSQTIPTRTLPRIIRTNPVISKIPEIDQASALAALSTVQAPEMPALAALKLRALMGMLPGAPSLPNVQAPGLRSSSLDYLTFKLPGLPSAPGLPSTPGLPGAPSVPSMPSFGVPSAPGLPGTPGLPSVPSFNAPSVPAFGVPSLPSAPSAPGLPNFAMPGVPQMPSLNAQEALAVLQVLNGMGNF